MANIKFQACEPPKLNSRDIKAWQEIARSSFGRVYKARWRNRSVIVRKFEVRKEKDRTIRELNKLKQIKHRNIIKIFGACTLLSDILLVTEYANGGSLYDLLDEESGVLYSKEQAASWAYQCAQAVAHLHTMEPKILHRDLNPRNLLLTSDYKIIKICDFGPVAELKYQIPGNVESFTYMAPELFMGDEYTEKSDVYSWAIIFWEMLAHEHPYEDLEARVAIPYLTAIEGKRPRPLDDCPQKIVNLINKSWSGSPTVRPSMEEIVEKFNQFHDIFPNLDYNNSFDEESDECEEINEGISIESEKNKYETSRPKWVSAGKDFGEDCIPGYQIVRFSSTRAESERILPMLYQSPSSCSSVKSNINPKDIAIRQIEFLRNARKYPHIIQLLETYGKNLELPALISLIMEYVENGVLHGFLYNEPKQSYTLDYFISLIRRCAEVLKLEEWQLDDKNDSRSLMTIERASTLNRIAAEVFCEKMDTYRFAMESKPPCPEKLKKLIASWEEDPSTRPSAYEIFKIISSLYFDEICNNDPRKGIMKRGSSRDDEENQGASSKTYSAQRQIVF